MKKMLLAAAAAVLPAIAHAVSTTLRRITEIEHHELSYVVRFGPRVFWVRVITHAMPNGV